MSKPVQLSKAASISSAVGDDHWITATLFSVVLQKPLSNGYTRSVGGLGKYDHVTPVLRDTLHWLPIQQRIEFKVASTCNTPLRLDCSDPKTQIRPVIHENTQGQCYHVTRRLSTDSAQSRGEPQHVGPISCFSS